jgi:hypothetical protein
MKARRIGILFGPASGDGGEGAAQAEKLLSARLSGRGVAVAVAAGPFSGSGQVEGWKVIPAGEPRGYVAALKASVAALAEWGADLLICVGGDGLASYAADAALSCGKPPALLGVAAGTINVGPIISTEIGALGRFDPEAVSVRKVSAVEVLVDGVHLAYGFNDIVIGDTFLGTVRGQVVSLSVEAMAARVEKVEKRPSGDIAGPEFRVRLNGVALETGTEAPWQIIASPLGAREFYARAITGALCNAAYMPGPAAIGLFDSVIVKPGAPDRGLSSFMSCRQLVFGPGDVVELEGLGPAAHIVADGNPFVRKGGKVQFKSAPDLVDVARLGE